MNWMTSAKKRVYRRKRSNPSGQSDDILRQQVRQKYEANQRDAQTLLHNLHFGKAYTELTKSSNQNLSSADMLLVKNVPSKTLSVPSNQISATHDPLQDLQLSPSSTQQWPINSELSEAKAVQPTTEEPDSTVVDIEDTILYFDNGSLLLQIPNEEHSAAPSLPSTKDAHLDYKSLGEEWNLFDGFANPSPPKSKIKFQQRKCEKIDKPLDRSQLHQTGKETVVQPSEERRTEGGKEEEEEDEPVLTLADIL